MDVDKFNFGAMLPTLLTSIAKARFVAIDLELSGIPTRGTGRGGRDGKQDLEERYRENKAAAEKYTVLQVGITCVEEDQSTGVYTTRPYNININPLVEQKIDLDRDFSFQGGAVTFLLDHGFKIDAPMTTGVHYLSRQEEAFVRQKAEERDLRVQSIGDIIIREDDTAAHEFYIRTREQIKRWTNKQPPNPDYLNISPPGFEFQPNSTRGLSNFQKRLVHQLVRSEFPGFMTISKPYFVQVVPHDESREVAHKLHRNTKLDALIVKQTGFRWIVEAMAGGDISKIDPMASAHNAAGNPIFINKESAIAKLTELREALSKQRTVLVGHNVFMDLIYFYQTFIGDLPEKFEDFKTAIHKMFPLAIDTKYLATYIEAEKNTRTSLEDVEEDLKDQLQPIIELHPAHEKYLSGKEYAHEAGYDSFVTAKVLIQLATRLEAKGGYIGIDERPSHDLDTFPLLSGRESGGVPLQPSSSGTPLDVKASPVFNRDAIQPEILAMRERLARLHRAPVHQHSAEVLMMDGSDSYDMREADDSDEGGVEFSAMDGNGNHAQEDSPPVTPLNANPHPHDGPVILMPAFDGDFWRIYGNKLRVFGTEEEVARLDPRYPGPGSEKRCESVGGNGGSMNSR